MCGQAKGRRRRERNRCSAVAPTLSNRSARIQSPLHHDHTSFILGGVSMFLTPVKTFVHPHEVYRLEYPAHWDQVIEKEGESCGFGPHDRDDVGLWISIMPMSVDTAKMTEDLPMLMGQAL